MEFIHPSDNTFTIYTKSGCPGCLKAKKLLSDLFITPLIIDCDDYLIDYRSDFLQIIKKIANIINDEEDIEILKKAMLINSKKFIINRCNGQN